KDVSKTSDARRERRASDTPHGGEQSSSCWTRYTPASAGALILRYPGRFRPKPVCRFQADLASIPCRTAHAATSARPPRPSFIKMLETWTAAVLGEMYKRSAS